MDAAESFIARQLAREPNWRLLPVFLPADQRGWMPAWIALLGEIDEAMFEVSDPRVAQTKLAWWGEDLAAGARAQHPLSRRLLAADAAAALPSARWRALAAESLRLALVDFAPADWADAQARWEGLARCVADIESQLCGRQVGAGLVREQWQWQRLWSALRHRRMERSVAPLPLQAPALLDYPVHPVWDELYRHAGGTLAEPAPTLPRELLRRGWQQRLRALRRGVRPEAVAEPSPLAVLWRSWRSARQITPR